jgi:hypothetical protein
MELAPVVVFTYNRLEHTRLTIEALARNELAGATRLILFSDGPKTGSETDRASVGAVREYLERVSGFASVRLLWREKNLGLARSIIDGVTEVCNEFGKLIVLEDDLISSPWFLRYMNDGLTSYDDTQAVISVHGYVYPVKAALPETFLLRGADCWGWGTWERGWRLFNPDGRSLLGELDERKLTREFDLGGAYGYTAMLRDQVAGRNDSWAVRWHASSFLRGKLTLYPGRSLIRNIGCDASGAHCGTTEKFTTELSENPVCVRRLPTVENLEARRQMAEYLRVAAPGARTWLRGLFIKLRSSLSWRR